LYRAAERGIAPDYAGRLLAAFLEMEEQDSEGAGERIISSPTQTRGIAAQVEPLSERELEVLACLTEGLSNREIAQRLTISLTTVKSHTRNIYRKFDVNSRTQAVAKGKALGLSS
jgi:ATP/maltotriose-dependent transcriptional regulator MalT